MGIEERYDIAPYMEAYDKLSVKWRPFVMHSHPPNYISEVVNTDQYGFRHTYDKDGNIAEFNTTAPVNIVAGGSTAFGVGATKDGMTLSSLLSKQTEDIWLNYGARGYSSSQEVMLFLLNHQRHNRINKIILFSGINDLVIDYRSKYFDKEFGNFLGSDRFYERMEADLRLRNIIARPLLSFFIKVLHGDVVDCSRLTLTQCMRLITMKKNISGELSRISNIAGGSYRGLIDHDNFMDDIFYVLKKNIINMKMIGDYHGAELVYVLQPWAYWLKQRVLAYEEKRLFDILDNSREEFWADLDRKVSERHRLISNHLRDICSAVQVRFYDSNEFLNDSAFDNQHIFVDRIHLTDLGHKLVSEYIEEML